MDYIELDETLKLLNGLDNDLSKRNNIINYIKENNKISIFAYGSLLWNPIEFIDEIITNCILKQYRKEFFCEDFIYRGTKNFTGLTMGLENNFNDYVNGSLFTSYNNKIISFIKSFVKRETPIDYNNTKMDIYTYDFVKILMPDKINTCYALTCIVNKNSLFYLNNKLTLDEQAFKISQAIGLNGTNFEYLDKLIKIYMKFNINDSSTEYFQNIYIKVIQYKQSLKIFNHIWIKFYNKLKHLKQNKTKKIILFNKCN